MRLRRPELWDANRMSAGRRPPGMIATKPTPKRVVMRLAKTTISTTATSKARLNSRDEYYDECRPPSARGGYGDCRRICFGFDWHCRRIRLSRPLWLVWVATAAACYQSGYGPSKIVPAASGKDTQSNKLITERVNERGQSEKLVSREEQPIDKPTTVVLSQVAPQQSSLGSGVVGSEPKKVRTIAIRPDQSADAAPAAAPLATTAAARAPQASSAPAKPAAMPARPPETPDC